MKRSDRPLLIFLALFCLLLFVEAPGSSLFDPDEARYAEVPREMNESGQWLVPRLNYVDYFEKPPLLYWANALSIRILGPSSYAARLPTRLSALGIVLILVFGLRRRLGDRTALLAGLIYLSSPLPFALGRVNLTDGLLTFFMTLCSYSIYRFLQARDDGRSAAGWAALTGLAAGAAVLTKGLVGIVLPGAAFVLWCAITRKWTRAAEILLSFAPVVCLAVTVPYFVAVEHAAPGFSKFFFIHEHFARYATSEAERPGSVFYFLAAFLWGFLPWTFFLPSILRRFRPSRRERLFGDPADLWFGLYAGVILLFFSLSHSKLTPYILPMFPAAAILLARTLAEDELSPSRPLRLNALLWTLAAPAGVWFGFRSGELDRYRVPGLAIVAAAALVSTAWLGSAFTRRHAGASILAPLAGWAVFYACLIAALPRVAVDQSAEMLAGAARDAAGRDATVACYRTYLQGFPWILERRLSIYGWKRELEFGSTRGNQSAWFHSAEDFWKDWDSNRKMVVLMRRSHNYWMRGHRANLVAQNRNYLVIKNF